MTRGRIVNKKTQEYLTGERMLLRNELFNFRIDGTNTHNTFTTDEWEFEADEPELRIWIYAGMDLYQKRRGEPLQVSSRGQDAWRPAISPLEALEENPSTKLIYTSEGK